MDSKKWNEEVLGIEECRALWEELLRKAKVVRDLEKCALIEEVSWRQKFRVCG
jgi:hypothetical protein